MPEDRRYTDDEVSLIFAKAAEGPQPTAPPTSAEGASGLTLTELQEIGREVGIAPDAVAAAARSLDVSGAVVPRRVLGFFPIGVERTVSLGRWMSDEEWERLVVQLRETFDARGTMSENGKFRQWTNGNLQALLEPTANGHRLRMRTTKGSARAAMRGGMMVIAVGGVVTLASTMVGQLAAATPGILLTAFAGSMIIAVNALRLPRWARIRGQQMDAIASSVAGEGEPHPG